MGTGLAEPDLVDAVGNLEGAELSEQPSNNHGNGRGQDEPGKAAEGTLGDGSEGVAVLASPGLAQWLERTNETGEETEDGDADAALWNHSEDWHLPEVWRHTLSIGGQESGKKPGTGEVGSDDADRGDATQALRRSELGTGWR